MDTASRRNWISRSLIILLISAAILPLTSCSKKSSAAIVGKWRIRSTGETVEFRKDGTVNTFQTISAGPPGGIRTVTNMTTGKYIFTDAGHMNVQINTGNTNQPAISMTCEVHVDGDTMKLDATMSGEHKL